MIRQLGILLLGLGLVGCSAIELGEQNEQATIQAEVAIENTVQSQIATQAVDLNATLETVYEQATSDAQAFSTQVEETLNAIIEPTPSPDIESTAEITAETTPDVESTVELTPEISPNFVPESADISIFASVPIDSDSLNSVTALAFDREGHLLVSLRAGEIYRLQDDDQDGVADETTLIFEDVDNEIGQVSGIFSQNAVLYILNGNRLSQLRDADNDGLYETITHLSESLPANQSLLQANNSIVRSPDGRYFTVDINRGEILQLLLSE